MIEVIMQARTPEIGEMVEQCARGEFNFGDLCEAVSRMGYKTTSLYEMVRAAEAANQPTPDTATDDVGEG